jgi:hypothetical protein
MDKSAAFTAGWMNKIAGSRLRQMAKVVPRFDHFQGTQAFDLMLGGKRIAQASMKPGRAQLHGMQMDRAYRGMGLGKKFYGEIMRRMPEARMYSDYGVRTPAGLVWKGMPKRGYKFRETPPGGEGLRGARFMAQLPAKARLEPLAGIKAVPGFKPNTATERAANKGAWREEMGQHLHGRSWARMSEADKVKAMRGAR